MMHRPTTGIITPQTVMLELSGDTRPAKVSHGADPQHADGGQANLYRAKRRAKQLRTVAHGEMAIATLAISSDTP